MKNLLILSQIILLVLIQTFAYSGEIKQGITVYEGRKYSGKSLVIENTWDAKNSSDQWANRIESIKVPKGYEIWLYKDYHFHGRYKVLRGDWDGSGPADTEWRNQIKGIKIVKRPPPPPPGGGQAAVVLDANTAVAIYENQGWQGKNFFLNEDWSAKGPNDFWAISIESIKMPAGWAIMAFKDYNFQGASMTLTKNWDGKDAEAWKWRNNIKSIRIVKKRPPKAVVEVSNKISIFENQGWKGKSFQLTDNWSAKGPTDYWANTIESIKMPPGWMILVYKDYNFLGAYMTLDQSWDGKDAEAWKWRNNIKSIRVVKKANMTAPRPPITVYEHSNFQGKSKNINKDWTVGGAEGMEWNDFISSIKIPHGVKVIIFEHAQFQGKKKELTSSWTTTGTFDTWNDQISSIKVIYP